MSTQRSHQRLALLILRVLVSISIFCLGAHKLLQDDSYGFELWLNSQGLPLSLILAWIVTLTELFGAPLLAVGLKRPLFCSLYAIIYLLGLLTTLLPMVWFIVGPISNHTDYSVLLIVSLFVIGFCPRQKTMPISS